MFDAAKYSIYNGLLYKEYKTSAQKIAEIGDYVSELNRQRIFSFKLYKPSVLRDFNKLTIEEKKRSILKSAQCALAILMLYTFCLMEKSRFVKNCISILISL